MPSLEEVLKKNNAKIKRIEVARPSLSIATEDRPYSITESKSFQPIFDQTSSELKNVFNADIGGMVNPLVTFARSENNENSIKETDNKVAETRQQSGNGSEEKALAMREHSVSNELAMREHSDIIALAMREQSVSNTLATPLAMREQKLLNKRTDSVSIALAMREQDWAIRLSGKEKELLDLIFNNCQAHGKLESERLTSEYICNALGNISDTRLRNLIHRLIKKNVLSVCDIKNGRGGWRIFGFKQETFKKIHSHKALAMREHSVSKTNSIALATPLASASSSSSVLNIKETTTELDNEWNFDITPYSKFGFMTSQLKQLASLGVISAMEVAQSLIEFNHDLDNNALPQKMNTGKLNFLMGILRKGQSYVSEGYKNEEEAIISEMARRAEDKRKKLIEDKFVAWEASLSDEERKKIEDKIPLNLRVLFRVHGLSNLEVKNWLFNYYLQACIT